MLAGLLCSLYLILFVLGMGSNSLAIIRLVRVYGWIRRSTAATAVDPSSSSTSSTAALIGKSRVEHLIWLSLVLVTTDLALVLCLCFLISDVLARGWHLGSALCWYYWWSENVAKSFVAFLLSALALERWVNARGDPTRGASRRSAAASWVVGRWAVCCVGGAGVIVVVALAAPLQPYVGVQTLMIEAFDSPMLLLTNLTKCGISEWAPKSVLRYHVLGSFCMAYLLPLCVSLVCYASAARIAGATAGRGGRATTAIAAEHRASLDGGVDERFPSLASSITTATGGVSALTRPEPIDRRITWLSASISGTYVLCWSPYWVTTLVIQFGHPSPSSPFTLPFTLFVCHLLPYVNATLAGLLFVNLAKRLKLLQLCHVLNHDADEASVDNNTKSTRYHEMRTTARDSSFASNDR